MRLKNMVAALAATTMVMMPVAASANPAAALSVAAVQEAEAGSSGGTSAGTIVGILAVLAAVTVGVIASDSDSN